ncbi:hypothetical protein ACHAWF_004410 [Thalassiosira exigua]
MGGCINMSSCCQRPVSKLRPYFAGMLRDRHFRNASTSAPSSTSEPAPLLTLERHDIPALASGLRSDGYARTTHPVLTPHACDLVNARLPKLFRGAFDTGVYPDEWHWREGISRPDATREMCNAWKSDRTIASIILDEELGRLVARIAGWDSVRVAQDDVVWKPPCAAADASGGSRGARRIDTVGFHQDSAYISVQFDPYERNSVTLWMALDDADDETGCLEYAAGSHEWRPILHRRDEGEQRRQRPDLDASTDREGEATDDGISSFHSSDEASYRDGLSTAADLAGVSDPYDAIRPAPVKRGHAVLHDQDTWHGSGPNRSSTRHRRALVGHYLRGDATFRESGRGGGGPFGRASYIYGRYKRYDCVELDESFFPVVYGANRTAWIDDFIRR